jgi:hypothetical protein
MGTTRQPVHVKIELDEEVLARAIRELGLRRPPKFILSDRGYARNTNMGAGLQQFRGLYEPRTNTVRIASQHESSQRERLIELTKHVKVTVLHELRHAWQRENWSPEYLIEAAKGDYGEQIQEQDADAWAEYAAPMFAGLVKITRRPVGGKTGFGRMEQRGGKT